MSSAIDFSVESASFGFSALMLQYDEPLSKFPVNVIIRRYTVEVSSPGKASAATAASRPATPATGPAAAAARPATPANDAQVNALLGVRRTGRGAASFTGGQVGRTPRTDSGRPRDADMGQGLTLVHFSAQPEPFLSLETV